ncbi:MAG: branched-chain amino acid ABC transporter substrate-binding protein [Planctomycetota bacterium]
MGASCSKRKPTGTAKETIKIISSLPMQGSALAQTQSMVNGIKMALEEVSYEIAGYKIVYESWDDATATAGKWDSAEEAKNANKAVRDPDIMIYIGTYNSGAAKISMPILNRANVLMISPANTYVGLTKPGQGESAEPAIYRPSGKINYFRIVPADDIQGIVGAEWAKKLGVKKVYILDDRELYGKGVADVFEKHSRKIGLEVLGHEGIDPKAPEYKALMTKIKALNPDLIYFGGTTQTNGGQIAKDMKNVGLEAKYLVPDGCYEQAFITAAGPENLNGLTYVTFGGIPPEKLTGKGAEFYRRYKDKYQTAPEAYAVYGYESAGVALESIRRAARKDRPAIIEACRQIKNFDGALGLWSFDENGDTSLTTMSGQIVRDGKFQFAEVLSINSAAPQ